MKLQKILDRFLRLHPKEIDLSLDRIKNYHTLFVLLIQPQEELPHLLLHLAMLQFQNQEL